MTLRIIDEGVLSHREGHRACMPSVTQLADDTFIACQHVGSSLAAADNVIEVLHSVDGKQWRNDGCMHTADGWACRSPDISELPGGRLVMTAGRYEIGDCQLFNPDTEELQRPDIILFWSEDGGAIWSPPQVVPVDLPPEKYTWNNAGSLLQFSADRWMFPFETWKPTGYDGPPDQKAAAVFSRDQGRSWNELTIIADDPTGKLLYWDQLNTRLPDDRVYVILWTHRYGTKRRYHGALGGLRGRRPHVVTTEIY